VLSGVFTFPVIVHRVGASSMFLLKTYGSFGMILLHSAESGMAMPSELDRMSMDRAIEPDVKNITQQIFSQLCTGRSTSTGFLNTGRAEVFLDVLPVWRKDLSDIHNKRSVFFIHCNTLEIPAPVLLPWPPGNHRRAPHWALMFGHY